MEFEKFLNDLMKIEPTITESEAKTRYDAKQKE